MAALRLKLFPVSPSSRKIEQIINILRNDGVIAYPTDSVYALGCNPYSKKGVTKMCKLKRLDPLKLTPRRMALVRLDPLKSNLTMLCENISEAALLAKHLDNRIFRIMKAYAPGPFTFILQASKEIPSYYKNKRKTIGIRIPDHSIVQAILQQFAYPLVSTSLVKDRESGTYYDDPEEIFEDLGHTLDCIIDGGDVGQQPTAIIDCTGKETILKREGPIPFFEL